MTTEIKNPMTGTPPRMLESSSPSAALYAALVVAQKTAKAVEKDSTNSYHKYRYASAEAIIDEARGALSAAGLAVFPIGQVFAPMPVPEEGKPWDGVTGRMVVQYRLSHESGACIDFESSTPVIPEKGRPADKAEATALTYNLGYFLRGLLLLPRVEEGGDANQRSDGPRQPPPVDRTQLFDSFKTMIAAAPDFVTLKGYGPAIMAAGFSDDHVATLSKARRDRLTALGLDTQGNPITKTENGAPSNGAATNGAKS